MTERDDEYVMAARKEIVDEMAAEIRRLRYWNSAIAVCADHTQDIVSVEPGSCVVCDLERLRAHRERCENVCFGCEIEGVRSWVSQDYAKGIVAERDRLREQVRVAREALEWDRALFARFGKGEGSRQNALHAWTRVGDALTQLEELP